MTGELLLADQSRLWYSLRSESTTIMATCRDVEGWRAVSRIREFDTTLCFEEGAILSVLLGGLLVVGAWRSLRLCLLPPRALTSKSRWLLRSKIVSILRSMLRTTWLTCLRLSSPRHLHVASPILALYSTSRSLCQSYSHTFLNRVRSLQLHC